MNYLTLNVVSYRVAIKLEMRIKLNSKCRYIYFPHPHDPSINSDQDKLNQEKIEKVYSSIETDTHAGYGDF